MELDPRSLLLSAQPIYTEATDNDPAADNRQNLAASAYCLLDTPNLETPNLMFAKEALKEKEKMTTTTMMASISLPFHASSCYRVRSDSRSTTMCSQKPTTH